MKTFEVSILAETVVYVEAETEEEAMRLGEQEARATLSGADVLWASGAEDMGDG